MDGRRAVDVPRRRWGRRALLALWRLLATSGLRIGEALGLRWRDVDWSRNRIVRRTRSKGVEGRVSTGTPKTQRGRRTADLDADTMKQLVELHDIERRNAPGDYVFLVPGTDEPLHRDGVGSRFRRLVRVSGLPHLSPHGRRDTHATLLLQQGEALHVVSRRLGHANEAFTARRYAAVLPGQQAEAVDRLARRLGETSPNGQNGNAQ
ncbi:MAG: site-specific integrase [Actinobacteria bacterium]|nr:site-specific integrase [Actinomycetota bacterium]